MKCCQCGSEKIAQGRVFNQLDYVAPAAYFRPNGLRPFAVFDINIRIKNIFNGCLNCGFMWAEVDPEKLKKVIIEKGTDIVKAKLGYKEE
ncbi:MAG: hypothetical protein JW867_05720 [Candidatus Omnitrophica bacterium]|nr:hypothetical protein [Candidatus Omnitrophota bacterium]